MMQIVLMQIALMQIVLTKYSSAIPAMYIWGCVASIFHTAHYQTRLYVLIVLRLKKCLEVRFTVNIWAVWSSWILLPQTRRVSLMKCAWVRAIVLWRKMCFTAVDQRKLLDFQSWFLIVSYSERRVEWFPVKLVKWCCGKWRFIE